MSGPSSALAPSVVVMLSTYNGAAFLSEQLESLAAQQDVVIRLHVRDDGSTDSTLAVLRSHARAWPELAGVGRGDNLGASMSFLELVRTAPPDAPYYAFCDQDDVWLPTKTARAVEALSTLPLDVPALYCSNVTCVDAGLAVLGVPRENADGSFQHLLFENIAYGCTVVMNAAARRLIAERSPQHGVVMHDWWCALVVAAYGRVLYDPEPRILYRQHGSNSIGAQTGRGSRTWFQICELFRRRRSYYQIHGQASELFALYSNDMPIIHLSDLNNLVDSKHKLGTRLKFALSKKVVRSEILGEIVARALILVGWY